MLTKTRIHSIIAGIFLLGGTVNAQMSSTVFVSGTEGCTSSISLSNDSRDMDVIVKFSFDEGTNTISMSLVSYRGLFVFRESARYSKIFRMGKLDLSRLPYETGSSAGSVFHSTRGFRSSLRKPVASYVFNRWVDVEGMQPVAGEFPLFSDRLDQSFVVNGSRVVVSLTLRDIALVDPARKEGHYNFVYDRDLSKRFDIVILRDGCFGKEEEIKASEEAVGAIRAAYDSLKVRFPGGLASSKESLDIFGKMKALLGSRFVRKDAESACACISDNLARYNAYVDSIATMEVKLPEAAPVSKPKEASPGINPDSMLSRARKIDMAVSRWMASKDVAERKDIVKSCRGLIAAGKEEIRVKGVYTQAQKNARDAFYNAEAHFNRTCK